jgi:Viral BACON domain
MKPIITLLTISLIISLSLTAQVYVKQDATGLNNGSSWQNAYTNLDTAISRTAAGSIWVAKGNYKPSVPAIFGPYTVFAITKKIALYGGFNGDETSFAQRDFTKNSTILNGDIGVTGDSTDNTPRVVMIYGSEVDSNTVLDGFTVKGAYYSYGHSYDYDNAAVMISGSGPSNPIVRNCRITENLGFYGAGVWVRNARPLITGNEIFNNTAYEGAGVYCSDYLSDAQVIGNRIYNNRCTGGYSHLAGGAIKVSAYSAPFIYGNLIENNAADYGGAISNESNYEITVMHNIITHNSGKNGGAIYVNGSGTKLINNLIAGNDAQRSGGALYLDYTIMDLTNNTITGNSSIEYGSAIYVHDARLIATNNIIYNNTSVYYKPIAVFAQSSLVPRFKYNNIENGINSVQVADSNLLTTIWEDGNISIDPGFADSLNYNFQLTGQSGCINKALADTTALYLPALDIALNKRISGNIPDMGCYEFDNTANILQGLKIAPNAIQLQGKADSTFAVNIQGTESWSITKAADWLTLNKTTGTGSGSVQVTAAANTNLLTARATKLLVGSNQINVPAIPVRINQSKGGYISLSADTVYISNDNFRSASFTLKSNTYWGINTIGWFRVTPASGQAGNQNIIVTADSNLTGAVRSFQLVVGNEYFNPQISDTIVVVQLPTQTKVCAGSTVKFYAGTPNATYQWQVNSGSGFVNMSDGAGFSGTKTSTLTVINVLSSSYGTQYKCLVNGATGPVYTIQIANTWMNGNTVWESTANWSCGKVPDANTDVIVFGGNTVISSNVTVRSMSVTNGATVTVQPGYTLTILH